MFWNRQTRRLPTHGLKDWWSRSSSALCCRWCVVCSTHSHPAGTSQTGHLCSESLAWSWKDSHNAESGAHALQVPLKSVKLKRQSQHWIWCTCTAGILKLVIYVANHWLEAEKTVTTLNLVHTHCHARAGREKRTDVWLYLQRHTTISWMIAGLESERTQINVQLDNNDGKCKTNMYKHCHLPRVVEKDPDFLFSRTCIEVSLIY